MVSANQHDAWAEVFLKSRNQMVVVPGSHLAEDDCTVHLALAGENASITQKAVWVAVPAGEVNKTWALRAEYAF